MKLARIRRLLSREFARSPAKTGILLALLPLAAYVILPLLRAARTAPGGMGEARVAAEALDATSRAVPRLPTHSHWRQVRSQIEKDARMTSVKLAAGARDPFRFAALADRASGGETEEEDAEPQAGPQVALRTEIAPRGLVLSATLLSGRARLATINGRTYREGEPLQNDGAQPWIVSQIGYHGVILERDGSEHLIRLQNKTESRGDISITRYTSQ